MEPVLTRTASVLLHWPAGVPAFVRSAIGTAGPVATTSSKKVLGIWANRFWRQLGGGSYGFFREEFWRQLDVLAPGVAGARCESAESRSFVSAGEAKKLFSVTRSWLDA